MRFSKFFRSGVATFVVVTVAFSPAVFAQSAVDAQSRMASPAAASGIPSQTQVLNPSQIQKITLSESRGEVLIQKGGTSVWIPGTRDMLLSAGDIVKTGENGAATLSFDGKARVDLVANTRITVQQASRNGADRATELTLDLGRLKADIDKLSGESTFEITTPTAVASIRGTVLFLNAAGLGQAPQNQTSDLYVDKGLVHFAPLDSLKDGVLVDKFGLSSILGDGTTLDLRHLSKEERDKFIDLFNQAFNQAGNPQGEIEESGAASDEATDESDADSETDFTDKISEQDTKSKLAQEFLEQFEDLSPADQNRVLIGLLLLKTAFQQASAFATFEELAMDTAKMLLASEGVLSLIHRIQDAQAQEGEQQFESSEGVQMDEWAFENVSGAAAEFGVVSDERLDEEEIAAIDEKADEALGEIAGIQDDVVAIGGLLDSANATDNNAQFVPPAQDASVDADGHLAALEDQADAVAARRAQIDAIRENERQEIRGVMSDIIGDQTFNLVQAQIEQHNDQMTGKVFTDMHGNRVRTDEYIFQPDGNTVQVLSLTLRTGDYQPGISSFLFGVDFNQDLPEDVVFSDLPWNDYMNVVTKEEMATELDIPEQIEVLNDSECGVECGTHMQNNPDFDALSEQYIVHESGVLVRESDFWPNHFYAEFRNPQGARDASDLIRFDEFYGDPTTNIGNDFELFGDDEDSFFVQSRASDSTLIAPSGQDAILIQRNEDDSFFTVTVGDDEPLTFRDDQGDNGGEGSQANGFAGEFNENAEANPDGLSNEDGINYYRQHPNNDDGNVSNDVHPAHFEDQLHNRDVWVEGVEGGEGHWETIGSNTLLGLFVPIDNRGKVLDDAVDGYQGLQISGLRDLLVPNAAINGGNYNLEVIFAYGYVDSQTDVFHEDFRIDTIITPELLTHHGFVNDSELFPATLEPYEDECGQNCE